MKDIITYATFENMKQRVMNFRKNKGKDPAIVYIVKGGADFITIAQFDDMASRVKGFEAKYGREPEIVYIHNIKPAPKKGPIQLAVESHIGGFSNITKFYYLNTGKGYGHYYGDVATLAQEEVTLARKNCTDGTQLLVHLALEMGYQARYAHVICPKSGEGHVYAELKGLELGDEWVKFDMAANLSVFSKYPIGKVWCPTAIPVYNEAWLTAPDDGKT